MNKHINISMFVLAVAIFGMNQAVLAAEGPGYNTTRSNRSISMGTSGNPDAALHGKRKCIKSGGTFYEYPNGRKLCMPALKGKSMSTTEILANIGGKRKCWKTGGIWVTNSTGTFCYKKLKPLK